MAKCARKEIIRKGIPGIFHCLNRCVRRAFLFGKDPYSGKDHSERRDWVIERIKLLAACFFIDAGFTAVMSNHFHLVLRTFPRLAQRMGAQEIARRWLRVYPGKRVLDGKWIEPKEEDVEKLAKDKEKIAKIRSRLSDPSWLMAALSEYIARRCNLEDNCGGRFFEGRFSCREVTDESSLLICGMYVDLNQIRAGETILPEESSCCSIFYRLGAENMLPDRILQGYSKPITAEWLAPFTLGPDDLGDVPSTTPHRASDKGLLSMTFEEYLKLLDWVGRTPAPGKQGTIPANLAPILDRLGIVGETFVEKVENFPKIFPRIAGSVETMKNRAKEMGRKCLHGVGKAARIFRQSLAPAEQKPATA